MAGVKGKYEGKGGGVSVEEGREEGSVCAVLGDHPDVRGRELKGVRGVACLIWLC